MNLLPHLVCPNCRTGSSLRAIAGSAQFLHCATCDTTYGYRGDVPLFAQDDSDAFDARWARHRKPQATDQWFKAQDLWGKEYLRGKTVLDAGCGIGRYATRAFDDGAEDVVAVDISPHAIAAAHENEPRATMLQASLLNIPLPDNFFDAAYSIGVIHHTPDPRQALNEIIRVTKRHGLIVLWVYSDQSGNPAYFPVADFLHEITRICPKAELYEVIKKWAPTIRDVYADRWDPLMQVLRVSVSKDDEECVSDTLDWNAPRYRSRHSVAEISNWCQELGAKCLRYGKLPLGVLIQKL